MLWSDAENKWVVEDKDNTPVWFESVVRELRTEPAKLSGISSVNDEKIAWTIRAPEADQGAWLVYRRYPSSANRIWEAVGIPLVIASVVVLWLVFWASISIANLVGRTRTQNELLQARAQELAEARDGERKASRAKSMFLANMSHEIRTPLNAILGLSQIGLKETKEGESRDKFSHILAAGEHLLDLINDVLDFSKIEAGKLLIEPRTVHLQDTVRGFINMISARAEEKDLTLTLDFGPDLPGWVKTDPLRLRQILLNLLSNAVKFTHQGNVSLSIAKQEGILRFTVKDSGIGLNDHEISRLFAPFEQADSSTTRQFGGTGLGLKISRDLALLMGGDISVDSKKNVGSTFTLTLPLVEVSAPAKQRTDTYAGGPRLVGYRFLAAEDVSINRMILERVLQNEGAEVVFAENGKQAVDLVRQAGGEQFDAVLMDIQMPVMDGYEATRQILSIEPHLPVIGLTAHALEEERDKCLSAGMVAHVTKPFDLKTLATTLSQYVKEHSPATRSQDHDLDSATSIH